jgi:hypothetical protein
MSFHFLVLRDRESNPFYLKKLAALHCVNETYKKGDRVLESSSCKGDRNLKFSSCKAIAFENPVHARRSRFRILDRKQNY